MQDKFQARQLIFQLPRVSAVVYSAGMGGMPAAK